MSGSAAPPPLLELQDVAYAYAPDIPALDGLSLAVEAGARVAILGPNGCGKSTLLQILAGLRFPGRGAYRAFQRDITERALSGTPFGMFFRKAVGIVFQNAEAQLFNASVEEEIAFGPRQLGEPEEAVRQRTEQLMALFGLRGLAGRPPFALSGGEKRKVALASVLVMDPAVLLLDEPTAGLDPRSTRLLVDLIVSQAAGRTAVTTTNELHIVPEIADRVLILGEDRRLLAAGRPEDLLRDRALLRAANLVHRHRHAHEDGWHEHEHEHDSLVHWHRHEDAEKDPGGH
ncbi:MAG: energy-coupling factor ABC transporter ATP-binding protein [Candidatus Methylomirabilales bacterium]